MFAMTILPGALTGFFLAVLSLGKVLFTVAFEEGFFGGSTPRSPPASTRAAVLGEKLKDFDLAQFAFGMGAAACGEGEMLAEAQERAVVGGHAEGFRHEAGTTAIAGLAAGEIGFGDARGFPRRAGGYMGRG